MDKHSHGANRLQLGSCAIVAGLLYLPGAAPAQSLKEQIVGTWRIASLYSEEGGQRTYPFTEKPVGLTMFDRTGHVVTFLSQPDVPKFAVPNRLKATEEETRRAYQAMISGFGTYTVLSGDQLTAVNPTAASGGTSYQTLVRVPAP